ncbi:hypothetical protein, partial [Mycobacterium avium]|uniref:hypothetical protein n=1 Tax=Mycobacterium avium TaxID=1764 RepID=UPI001CC4C42F
RIVARLVTRHALVTTPFAPFARVSVPRACRAWRHRLLQPRMTDPGFPSSCLTVFKQLAPPLAATLAFHRRTPAGSL